MQNILVVMADQLSALALGCYRNPDVKSPNIDRLAEEGVLFDAAYSSSPLCTPARYAFMTGQNISDCGGYDNDSSKKWLCNPIVGHLEPVARQ